MLAKSRDTRVQVPRDWTPRDYQRPLWDAMKGGCRRADEALAARRPRLDDGGKLARRTRAEPPELRGGARRARL